ncbi:glycosyltransferase [Acuticoccus mangrovi]|uniref:Glycosyltransferase n=1 Tax=Acuticoccus mangrovi TaxID=2796142 RepID=A0A934MIB4_9HYPH|nr:glycosyltransferase family 2 protein [Acuticoccus mangrovi]MBJ3778588.1 glycosyltransferase [Acuticoccus mangrovi]
MTTITILIPTRNRPGPLARALASVSELRVPDDYEIEVVVVDNSDDGNARDVVAGVPMPFAITRIHVREPGVATARNRGLAEAQGEVVAFLDDDCEAPTEWLAAQVGTLLATGADGSFGPRIAKIDGPEPEGAAWFTDTYSRDLAVPEGTDVSDRDAYLPLPGSAFLRERCFVGPTPFDQRLDDIGGEDVLLFRQLVMDGRRFVWSPRAAMVEYIPLSRLDRGFVMRRRYLSGQHRCLIPMMVRPPQRGEMLMHMAKGAAATLVAGPLALLGRLGGRWPAGPTGLLMSGLGKLTWWRKDRPALYGKGHR